MPNANLILQNFCCAPLYNFREEVLNKMNDLIEKKKNMPPVKKLHKVVTVKEEFETQIPNTFYNKIIRLQ